MCLKNRRDGRESRLLRALQKDSGPSIFNPSILFHVLAVLATGDAASGIIDPSLPQWISLAAISSLAIGATFSCLFLPQLNKLPQRSVEVTIIRQQLLSQYDLLESRIRELKQAVENEVWMLARMCQLENKIYAVGEPSYRICILLLSLEKVKSKRYVKDWKVLSRIELS